MPDPRDVAEGDLAFAWNVQQLADILIGRRSTQVRLTRWSSADEPSLKVANRNAAGPIIWAMASNLTDKVMVIDGTGIRSMDVNGYFDFLNLDAAPDAPAADSDKIRFYARNDQFFFRFGGGAEQQIPIGAPPGPMARFSYWMT